ncbi:Hypothetical predicted protein [Olea europaea subsp. europaea]|uniref:Uncharacterized protein n=2 Tax=Olea europaea subsp. europaea TaxID=158383 RepID=A0A8S0Q170_OLEEU|nr:Hypothetical predicted protein [Olea europaea subsp. europaea]
MKRGAVRGGARGGGRGASRGMKRHQSCGRHDGLFYAEEMDGAVVTKNLVPGATVHNETRISTEV